MDILKQSNMKPINQESSKKMEKESPKTTMSDSSKESEPKVTFSMIDVSEETKQEQIRMYKGVIEDTNQEFYRLAMGNMVLQDYNTYDEAISAIENKSWDLMVAVMACMFKTFNK